MGRVTVDEAAAYANVKNHTIWEWIRSNQLTRRTMQGRTTVELGELTALIDEDSRLPPTPQLMAVIMRRMEKLEREIEFLMYTGGYATALEMSDEEAVMAYRISKKQAERARVPDEDYEGLVSMLETLPEEAMDAIREREGVRHPWVPFFQLMQRLKHDLKEKKFFKTSLEYQKTYNRLTKAQERLRAIALIHIEADTNSESRNRLIEAVGPNPLLGYELIRRTLWNKDKACGQVLEALSDDPQELLEEAIEQFEPGKKMKVYRRKRVVRRLEKALSILKK